MKKIIGQDIFSETDQWNRIKDLVSNQYISELNVYDYG